MLLRRPTHAALATAGSRPAPKRPSLPLACRAQCRVRGNLASFGQAARLLSDMSSLGRRYLPPTARVPLHSDHDSLEGSGSPRPISARACTMPRELAACCRTARLASAARMEDMSVKFDQAGVYGVKYLPLLRNGHRGHHRGRHRRQTSSRTRRCRRSARPSRCLRGCSRT